MAQDNSRRIDRRSFLKGTLGMAGGLATAPYIVPSTGLAMGGVAPSERITMGIIGVGGRCRQVLPVFLAQEDVHVVAVCEVNASRRRRGKQIVDEHYGNNDCDTYHDLRNMLARDDIDAIFAATGDRWHTPVSIMSMKAGKDIYCEKPCSLTVEEGRELADAVERYGRVYQAGTQRRSVGNFAFAVDLARSGKLGELKTTYAAIPWLGVNRGTLPAQPEPPKDELDWDFWLGPVPWHEYNEKWIQGQWKRYFDFSGGGITEWGSHTLDLCQLANDAQLSSPVEYERDGDTMVCTYANGVKCILRKPGWKGTCGVRFEGTEGWVQTDDSGQVQVHPDSLMVDRKLHTESWKHPVAHPRNFLECVKSRSRPVAFAEAAHRTHTACHCANIALWLERKVRWDPEKEEFIDDPEANRMRSRARRQPWQL